MSCITQDIFLFHKNLQMLANYLQNFLCYSKTILKRGTYPKTKKIGGSKL